MLILVFLLILSLYMISTKSTRLAKKQGIICVSVRFRRGRKFVVLVVGGHAAS